MAFFDRLAEAAFPGSPPPDFETFRAQCRARERAGRDTHGFAYLSRENVLEGLEEAADGALYSYLDTLRATREGVDPEMDLALTAALKFYEGHQALRQLRARRHGAP